MAIGKERKKKKKEAQYEESGFLGHNFFNDRGLLCGLVALVLSL